MEHSGKWGEDLDAIAHLKTAFYSELCKILNEKFSMHAYPYEKHAIVLLVSWKAIRMRRINSSIGVS